MRDRAGCAVVIVAVVCAAALASGCAARRAKPAQQAAPANVPTAYPTVPLPGSGATPVPVRTAVSRPLQGPLRTAGPGETIGPEITFVGITRADGKHVEPESVDKNGIPTYKNYVGSGFQLVVEAKPGTSGYDVSRRLFNHSPNDPAQRPDLEIQVSRPLGDGSAAVCDRMRPNVGGIPAINPPSFAETQKVADALNDLSCRFEIFIESESSCTLNTREDWAYKMPDTQVQFCMMVAKAWNFPVGETLVSVRLRDRGGNPGPVKQFRLVRPKHVPTPVRRPTPVPTPKTLPTR
jgi:hypothetical protein